MTENTVTARIVYWSARQWQQDFTPALGNAAENFSPPRSGG